MAQSQKTANPKIHQKAGIVNLSKAPQSTGKLDFRGSDSAGPLDAVFQDSVASIPPAAMVVFYQTQKGQILPKLNTIISGTSVEISRAFTPENVITNYQNNPLRSPGSLSGKINHGNRHTPALSMAKKPPRIKKSIPPPP